MEQRKKSILFVINTLGNAGAEAALLNLLRQLDPAEYDMYLYVLLGQGELVRQLPPTATLLNPTFNATSVLTAEGRRAMMRTVVGAFFRNGHCLRKLGNIFAALRSRKNCPFDKLLWRTVSDGALRFDKTYDLAVAYIEGGSTYYVADHVKARKKAAFVHIDYESSGYTRAMDQGCYDKIDRIFTVSDETQAHFLRFYPEYTAKTAVFHNILDRARIMQRAQEPGGFADAYDGLRLLTVGRLTYQKGYDIAIEAMRRVKQAGCKARWYVLGDGDQRAALEKQITAAGLQQDFVLLGSTDNPFPYYVQTDIYIHATRYEGKSIAIQEAQTLGCTVLASDCNGNREQIENGVDGLLCPLEPQALADAILRLADDPALRKRLSAAVAKKTAAVRSELDQLLDLLA